MPYLPVIPVIDPSVRELCSRPYPGHAHGCPNFGKRVSCPPHAPLLSDVLDLSKPVWAVYNKFDLAAHSEKMLARHPEWTERQCRNCLYWQGAARKQLKAEIKAAIEDICAKWLTWDAVVEKIGQLHQLSSTRCPEAMGVNVTATMAQVGIELEWPPVYWAYQVALLGFPRGGKCPMT